MSIDIILITYNQKPYIRQAIEGILMQRVSSNTDVRIIVADDCSTDNTFEKIHALLGTNGLLENRIKAEVVYLSRTSNLGHVRNYQRAFAACEGDYVAIIEGDDYWTDSEHLQTHIDFLEAHPECVLSTSHPVMYYEDRKLFVPDTPKRLLSEGYKYRSVEEEVIVNPFENLSACVIRNDVLKRLDERIYSCSILDWPMYVNLAQLGSLCLMSGSSNVYRIKKSGEYAGLTQSEQVQRDLKFIAEIEAIFPIYDKEYKEARKLLETPGLFAYLLSMGKNAKKVIKRTIKR